MPHPSLEGAHACFALLVPLSKTGEQVYPAVSRVNYYGEYMTIYKTAPLHVLRRELCERLRSDTGQPVSAGEQTLLFGRTGADRALKEKRYDEFRELLILHREANIDDALVITASSPRARSLSRTTSTSRAWPKDTAQEDIRAHVLSRQIMRSAGQDREVRLFREEFFGDPARVLSETDARSFLASPALRLLKPAELRKHEVPILGHQSQVRLLEGGALTKGRQQNLELRVKWDARAVVLRTHVIWDLPRKRLQLPKFPWVTDDLYVADGSCLDQLRSKAHRIASAYDWTDPDCAWFILTGWGPIHPLIRTNYSVNGSRVGHFIYASIRITAQPFASPKAVADAYGAIQEGLLGHRLGRPFEESNLMLLDFIQSQTIAAGKRPPWRNLLKDWNKKFPHWGYGDDSHLRRDYQRVEKEVLFPPYLEYVSADLNRPHRSRKRGKSSRHRSSRSRRPAALNRK